VISAIHCSLSTSSYQFVVDAIPCSFSLAAGMTTRYDMTVLAWEFSVVVMK
jgi:hypothetical protein